MLNRTIKLMTYNMLATPFISRTSHPHVQNFDLVTSWEHRWPLFKQHFKNHSNYDVFCLQEVERSVYDSCMVPLLNDMGFCGIVQEKKKIGNAVFYKTEKFRSIHVNERSRALVVTLEFVQRCTVNGDGDERLSDAAVHGREMVTIANVHLEGSPCKPQERFNQMKSLLNELQKNRKHTGEIDATHQNIIICGDFNCGPNCAIHHMLKTGEMSSSAVDANCIEYEQRRNILLTNAHYTDKDYSHPYRFKSAYQELLGDDPEFTYYVKGMKEDTLDFVYYTSMSKEEQINQLVPLSAEDPLLNRDLFIQSHLPSNNFPSDHLPLCVTFELKR